ncbi:MAG: DUF1847 domain-containing protein, partial [Clostridiaceae bacterium]|nr:DUF1847 domain-containing protein [Clostridiaceae bacterium]
MDCTNCITKSCRKLLPCVDNSEVYIDRYEEAENNEYIIKASSLVDNGRAGKLNRLEEIVEYCKASKYSKIGVAYCYSMDKEALKLKEYLTKVGFECLMVACTVD